MFFPLCASFQFFDKYGYVVVRDVLSSDQCLATIDDMWSYVETKGYNWVKRDEKIINPIRRDAPSTWNNGWPSGQAGGLVSNTRSFVLEHTALAPRYFNSMRSCACRVCNTEQSYVHLRTSAYGHLNDKHVDGMLTPHYSAYHMLWPSGGLEL